MKSEFNKAKLSEQIQALIDGTISREEFLSLQQTLNDDLEAQDFYMAQMEVESMLEDHFQMDGEFKVSLPAALDNHSETGISYRRIFLAVSACLAVILTMGNWLLIPEPVQAIRVEIQKELPASQVLRQSVARLTNGEEFQLSSSGWSPELGARLAAGNYQLSEGSIELTFDAGTKIYMSAPTSFGIVDFDEIHLRSGNLEADVPEQAIGFRVQTPAGKIVDFSTRFAVNVDESGASDIHVIEGLVEATPNLVDQQPIPLVENSSLRMIPDAFPEQVEFVPSKAVEFSGRDNADADLNYLHFSFDEELVDGQVPNQGTTGESGQLVSEEKDAWLHVAGKVGKAVFFSGKPAEIKTNVKGISGDRPRTIAFWTRIMPQTHARHSYSFMGWGSPGNSQSGQLQMGWNSNYHGDQGVEGAIRTEFDGGYIVGSTDLRDGKWHHVASVFVGGDGSVAQQVRHYVDGKLEVISGYENHNTTPSSMHQETLSVGKYIFADSPFYGTFKGWLDEVYLFDAALTPEQVVEVMKNNRVPAANEIVSIKKEN